ARRIFAIVSTTSIPDLAPVSPTEATVDPPSRGSRLDADHPENGVLIPCLFTIIADAVDVKAAVFGEHADRKLVQPVFVFAKHVGDVAYREDGAIAAKIRPPDCEVPNAAASSTARVRRS